MSYPLEGPKLNKPPEGLIELLRCIFDRTNRKVDKDILSSKQFWWIIIPWISFNSSSLLIILLLQKQSMFNVDVQYIFVFNLDVQN